MRTPSPSCIGILVLETPVTAILLGGHKLDQKQVEHLDYFMV